LLEKNNYDYDKLMNGEEVVLAMSDDMILCCDSRVATFQLDNSQLSTQFPELQHSLSTDTNSLPNKSSLSISLSLSPDVCPKSSRLSTSRAAAAAAAAHETLSLYFFAINSRAKPAALLFRFFCI
jgi:hypothetical protein